MAQQIQSVLSYIEEQEGGVESVTGRFGSVAEYAERVWCLSPRVAKAIQEYVDASY